MRRALGRWLAGEDGPGRAALPVGEFLHPAPLAALLVLAVNDHVLKGAGVLPGWVTGKLSDLAGVFFFPLLLTAAGDTLLCGAARLARRPIDFSLGRGRLALALVATAAVFVPLELSEAWGRLYVGLLGALGVPAATTRDATDLLALGMLAPAWWVGVAEIRRVPLGRLAVVARAHARAGGGAAGREAVRRGLADVRRLVDADPAAAATLDRLVESLAAWLAEPGDPARREAAERDLGAHREREGRGASRVSP